MIATTRKHPFLSLLLAAALLIVTVNALFAFRAIKSLQQSQGWVTHTWQVIHSLDQIRGTLNSAESANRDFLVTGERQDLEHYKTAKAALPAYLADFHDLTTDNPHEQQRSIAMQQLIRSRMNLLDRGAQLVHEGNAAAARALVIAGHGEDVMDQVVALTGAAQTEESRLLARRSASARVNAQRARYTILFATGLDLLLLFLMGQYMRKERILRETAYRTAEQLGKLQSLSDVALSQLTLSELTAKLLSTVREMVRADSAALGLLDGTTLTVTAAEGTPVHAGAEIGLETAPFLEHAIAMRKPARVEQAALADHQAGNLLHADTSSIMVAPLLNSSHVTALLVAGKRRTERFTEGDEQLLSITADRIALAIDRAQAYDMERAARQLAERSAEEVQLLNVALEDRVRERTAELEATNRELEAFSYSVSHDLRAPLRTIDGFSLALEEDYGHVIDSTGKNYIQRVRAGVQRMGTLIDALLQLSRITRADLQREDIDLSALADSIAADFSHQNKGRVIHFTIEPGLVANADPHLLRAALENLFGNAVKFTSKREDALIDFGWSPQQGAYYIRDNGAGFDPRYANKLFHAFNRLHGDKDFTGSGIGLASVARVIRRHQGSIWAQAEVDQGATFWFTLG